MSDRRAVSAGNLATASVANEPWRVAVGGNRVQNMTVEQIAHAFAAGQLTLRTPLWPPGTSGWQALGNFAQFQSGEFVQPQGYSQLSQFEEADDDPTRMWTGSADLSELPGMDLAGMEPMAPMPSAPPPPQQRPSARTGPRQVSTRAPAPTMPRSLPPPPLAPGTRMVSAAPSPAAVARSMRPQRSSGLWLVAGLVGLVGLGSAVLAARGSWSVAAPPDTSVAAATPAPEPARAVTAPSSVSEPKMAAAPSPAEAAAQADAPKSADTAAPPAANTEATGTPAAEVNQARLAKYEDTQASAFVAEAQPATKKRMAESKSATRESAKSKSVESKAKAAAAEAKRQEEASSAAKEAASEKEKESSKVSSAAPKHAAVAAAPAPKAKPHPASEAKTEAKAAEPTPVSSAVNDAAAAALGNSAKLASSCRPPGGASGPGKARVIYSNDGEVQSVEILTAKFRDTLTGSCVKMVFRRAKIPPFKGEPPTFIKSFTIPEE
jgi:hypothetical protein